MYLYLKALDGKTDEVLDAVDKDRSLLVSCKFSLLKGACRNNNPLLVRGLLERGANVHDTVHDRQWDDHVLLVSSEKGHLGVCAALLDGGADPDFIYNQQWSALSLAASKDHLQMCLLLISRGANLMMKLLFGVHTLVTALDMYGKHASPTLTPGELKERRAILLDAFRRGPHQANARWDRRWPFMSVVVGKYFVSGLHMTRLKQKVRHSLRRRIALQHFFRMRGKPIPLKTPEQRRNYYMIVIFSCEPLLRNIVSYL
jgi:hypothetical protein